MKADDKTVGKVRTDLESTAEIPQLKRTKGKDGKERPARKDLINSAPTPGVPINLGTLVNCWHEVEAQAAAGNKTRLKSALQRLLKEVSAALARIRR